MKAIYKYDFEGGKHLEYEVELDRSNRGEDDQQDKEIPEWVKLGHCQCSNCPLKESDTEVCPAAFDIQNVVNDFRDLPAFQKVDVTVEMHERTYSKYASLEEGLRSLMGLILATSSCPRLSKLKPMAVHHLPFSSNDEFILRSVSMYLLRQYFEYRGGRYADWDLKGLVEVNKELQLVNQALWQRIHSACESDSNLKALLSFFSMSSSVSFSLETQLQKLKSNLDKSL